MELMAAFKKVRPLLWLISALGVLAGAFLLTALLNFRAAFLLNLLTAAVFAGVAVLLLRKQRKKP